MRKFDLPAPASYVHGTQEDVIDKMTQLKPTSWRMEGPGKLVGDTPMGPLVQFVDPSFICKGTDDSGNPILVKIGEQEYT